MPDELDFSIQEETFKKMLKRKNEMGFGEKEWNEWFEYVLDSSGQSSPNYKIEKKWEKVYYDKFYDEWVQSFALNLIDIWRESSARELDPTKNPSYDMHEHSAIVIGRGPSVKKHGHLELLAKSNYKGSIICTDGALITALQAGVIPDKFPKFYVVCIDSREKIKEFFDDQIVGKYGNKIKGIFSTTTNPVTLQHARKTGIKIYWLHTLFDYSEGKKSFNQISALMVRAKNHLQGLPAIQTGGNVGTSSWFIAWQILKCSTIALIGINHGWNTDDPWDKITTHGYTHLQVEMDKNSPTFEKLYPKVYNPEFDCYCILDPIFQYYSKALKEFILRSPSWLTTINATEGGCIFGERIHCTTFSSFLLKYSG